MALTYSLPRCRTGFGSRARTPSDFPDLSHLSNELLLLIAEDLYQKTKRRDLNRLRLVSRRFHAVVTPLFWQRCILPRSESRIAEQLVCLSEEPSTSHFILELDIRFYEHAQSPPTERLSGVVFTLLAITSLSQLTTLTLKFDDAVTPRPQIPLKISNALTSLKHLRRLNLGPSVFAESFNLREAVLTLRELSLDTWECQPSMLYPSHGYRLLRGKPIAPITKLELFGASDGFAIADLIAPCVESLLVLRIEGLGVRTGLDRGETPEMPLPVEVYRGLLDRLDFIEVKRSAVMPLERLEVSTFSAFERALDLPEEDSDDEHEFTIKRYVLGDLLELLRLYAPKMRHLKLEDYGDITRFSLSQELSPWPIVRGITELELVATPANALQLLLTESIAQALRTFFSRLPSLTHLYLTGFLEPYTPNRLTNSDEMSFALRHPPLFAFLTLITREFPLIVRIEWRWRGPSKGQALVCTKRAGGFTRSLYTEY